MLRTSTLDLVDIDHARLLHILVKNRISFSKTVTYVYNDAFETWTGEIPCWWQKSGYFFKFVWIVCHLRKLPRQMPKKDTGTNSDHSTAPSCKWRAIDFSFKLPVPERRLLLKRSCFWISSAKSCSWFLSSLFIHDSWLSQNESPLPIRFSVLLLLICSNGFERVRRGCLVMPTSVMAASITICNNISMENLNPWEGQISDGSDI